jgi:hypothetical protein
MIPPPSGKQIEFLARAIVNRLEDRGLVEFNDVELGIQIATRVLKENFRTAEAIEAEARDRLRIHEKDASMDELESEIRRVAAEKSFAL